MSTPRRQGGDVLSWLSRLSFALSYLYIPSTWWPALYVGLILGGWACAHGTGRDQERTR